MAQEPIDSDPISPDSVAQTHQTQDPMLHEDQEPTPPAELTEESSHDLYEGFSDDAFVRAAAMFRNEAYLGIIELLTEAVETS